MRARHQKARATPAAREWKNVFLPSERRRQLLGWAEAIRRWAPGPYAFPPGLQWQPMHEAAKGCFEIREEHDKMLYRLFCVVDRKAVESGLTNPVVCFLDGASKAANSALPASVYTALGAMRKEYLSTNPRRVR
jgi:hypothetical protein